MTRHLIGLPLGLAILAVAGHAAMAQTTTLICNADASMPFTEDEPTTIELNEAKNSVAVHFSATTLSVNGGRIPAYSSGSLPATFAADTISFSVPHYQLDYTINRLTGSLVNSAKWKWNCQAGKKQF